MQETIKIQTPSGKEIIMSDGEVQVQNDIYRGFISINKTKVPQLKNQVYPVICISRTGQKAGYIVIREEDEKAARKFLAEISKRKAQEEQERIDAIIPGCGELKKAYEYRSVQFEIRDKYMERLYNTSIASGDDGKVEEAEAEVNRLETEYPVAKMYLKWSNCDPSSNYGYAANCAARALLEGASLEEAKKIAADYYVD